MGGYVVTAKLTRAARGPERTPRYIRDELWHKVESRIRFALARLPKKDAKPYRDVLADMHYFLAQRRKWRATDVELLFTFEDAAGMCHATAAAWTHWTSGVLATFAKTRKKEFAEDLGIELKLDKKLDRVVLYPHKGKLYVAQATGKDDVYLMGNGSDVASSKLTPAERTKVKKLVKAKTCSCPVCEYD